jgi:hypothetical protein
MFLVKDRRLGMDNFVFTQVDPRGDGYAGDVTAGVTLDYDMNAVHDWPHGQPVPNPQIGRDPADPKHYKVFKFPEELRAAGFEFVHARTPFVARCGWRDAGRAIRGAKAPGPHGERPAPSVTHPQYPACAMVPARQPIELRKWANSALMCSSQRLTRNSTSSITFNTVPEVLSG